MSEDTLEQHQMHELEQLAEANFFTEFIQTSGIQGVELNGRPKDSMQMYIEAAAEALNRIDNFDQSTARILKQVIDFLASDSRLKPEEFDQLRKNNAELTFTLNQLQKRFNVTNNDLQLANHRVEDLEEGINNVRKKNAELDCDLETANKHLESYKKQVKDLNIKVTEAYTEQLEIKKARDEAVKRQNQVVAQNVTQKSNIEKCLREIDSLKAKLQSSQQQEKDLRQKAADLQLKIDDYHAQNQTLKQQLSHVQSQYDSQQTLHNIEMDQLKARVDLVFNEKTELQIQVKSLQDQLAKAQTQITQLRKQAGGEFGAYLDGIPGIPGGGAAAAASEGGVIRGTVAGSTVPQVSTVDAGIQVYQTVRRIKDNHEEVVIDDQVSIFDKLNCITAELSETSHNCDFGDDVEELHADDNFEDLLRKIKTQFVKKEMYDMIQQKFSKSQKKYQKYKIKYETLSHEITVQGMLKQYHAIDESIKQLDDTMQSSGMDSAVASMQQNFKLLRISLETKLLRLEEQITDYVSKINISELKLLVGDKLTRVSKDSLLDEEIKLRAESLKGAPQSVQMMLAGLQELIEEPDRRVQKIEKQMKSQNEVIKTFVKEDKEKKKESAALKKAVEKAKKIQKVINQKLDINMANNKFVQTVFKGQDQIIQVKIDDVPAEVPVETPVEEPKIILEEKFMQTEEEIRPEEVEDEVQATVIMLDEEVQMEVIAVETQESGVQVDGKMATTKEPITAKLKTTYRLVTLQKKDLLDAKDVLKSNQQSGGANQGSKKRKIKVFTPSDQHQIPDTFKDKFDPNEYALEEIEEIEEVEQEAESLQNSARSGNQQKQNTIKPNTKGVEVAVQTVEIETTDKSINQSVVSQSSIARSQSQMNQQTSEFMRQSAHEIQTSALMSTQITPEKLDGETQYSLILETQQFNADLMNDLDRVDEETNKLLLEKLAEIEELKKQLQEAVEKQQQQLQQVKSRHSTRSTTHFQEESKSDTTTQNLNQNQAQSEIERIPSRDITKSEIERPEQSVTQGSVTMEMSTQNVQQAKQYKIETQDMGITGGPIQSQIIIQNQEKVDTSVQLEQIVADNQITKCNQSLQTSLQDMSAIIQKQMSKRSNLIKSQKAAIEERVQSVRVATMKNLPDVSSILDTQASGANHSDLKIDELSIKKPKTPLSGMKKPSSESPESANDVDRQNILEGSPVGRPKSNQQIRLPKAPEQQESSNETQLQPKLTLEQIQELYRQMVSIQNDFTQTEVPVVKYDELKMQTDPILCFDKEVQLEVQLHDLFTGGGGGGNQDYIKQQFKILNDEKERFKQQGLQLQTLVDTLQERIDKMNKEKKIQASIINQINANNQLKPRSKGDDKQVQTQVSQKSIDEISKQLLLFKTDVDNLIQLNDQLRKENKKLSKKIKEFSGQQIDADVLKLVNAQYHSYQPVAELTLRSVLDSNVLNQNIFQQLKKKQQEQERKGSGTNLKIKEQATGTPRSQSINLNDLENTGDKILEDQGKQDLQRSQTSLSKSTVNKFTKQPANKAPKTLVNTLQKPKPSTMQDAKKLMQDVLKPQIKPLENKNENSESSVSEIDDEVLRYVKEQQEQQERMKKDEQGPRKITEEQLKSLLVTLQYKKQDTDFVVPKIQNKMSLLASHQQLDGKTGKERVAALQKLRVLEQAIVPEIIPQKQQEKPVITVKCKKPRQIKYNIDSGGKYTYVVDGNKQKTVNSRPIVREYVFQNNRFISPFAEALEIREQKRKQKILESKGNRNGDIRMLSLIDYDEAKYLEAPRQQRGGVEQHFVQQLLQPKVMVDKRERSNTTPESPLLHQIRASSVAAVERSGAGESTQNSFWLLPNYDTTLTPSAINQKETTLFSKYRLAKPYNFEKVAQLRLVAQKLSIDELRQTNFSEKNSGNQSVQILDLLNYAEVENGSYFHSIFRDYCQYPVVVTEEGRNFVRLPPNCQLKQFAVILKTIKLFHYENDSGYTFLQFLEKKFMNKLMVGKFIAQFYVGLIYYLRNVSQKKEEIIELQLFHYFVISSHLDKQKQCEYFGMRKLLNLDRENPNTSTIERILQQNVEIMHFNDKKVELRDIIKKTITNVPDTSLNNFVHYLSQFNQLTHLQLLYVISQLNVQLFVKKFARYLSAYDQLNERSISRDQLIHILDSNIGYLSYETIKQIIDQQFGTKDQFGLTDIINVAMQFTQINMQKDDILSECVKKFQLCEEMMKHLIDMDEIKDLRVLEQLQEQRNQIQIKIGQRNGLIGLLYCNQYYDNIQKIYKQKVIKQDNSIQLEIVKNKEEVESPLRRNTTEAQQFESIDV